MQIDYLVGDDWEAIYINGKKEYEDHSIRTDHWIDLIVRAVADGSVSINQWEFYFWDHGYSHGPNDLEEIREKLEPM